MYNYFEAKKAIDNADAIVPGSNYGLDDAEIVIFHQTVPIDVFIK